MILGLPKVIQPPLSFASYEDQMLNHKNYVKIPSPGPGSVPLDGSYYNMQSERYLSYPPMHPQFQDHPIEFPIASSALQHISGHDMNSRNNTLNRRSSNLIANLIPPPDVTHHTNKMQTMHLKGPHMGNLMDAPPQAVYKQQPHHPPSILKDPKRNQQNHHVNKDLQMQNLMHSSHLAAPSDGDIAANHNSVLMNAYDNSNLNSFNAQLGISDQDGHLV